MAEIQHGLRHLLARPLLYDLFQRLVGAHEWRRRVIERHVINRLNNGGSVLDIGCATAHVITYLPAATRYFGFDRNAEYNADARKRFAGRNAVFRCESVGEASFVDDLKFDVVLAFGLLHHLNDSESLTLLATAKAALTPDGVLVTLDPVFIADASKAARYVVSQDRGKDVRWVDEYLSIAATTFSEIEYFIDKRPLRIPYGDSHVLPPEVIG